MIRPDFKEFSRLAREATLVPVAKSISADLLTPVSAFLAVAAGEPDAFLLESVDRGEKIGRYTFLGVRPFLRLESRGTEITIRRDSQTYKAVPQGRARNRGPQRARFWRAGVIGGANLGDSESAGSNIRPAQSARIPKIETRTANIFEVIKELLRQYRPAQVEGLPPFTAGAVGYCAYDIVRQLENIGSHARSEGRSRACSQAKDDLHLPDCILMFFDRILAFDHLYHQIHIVASADVPAHASKHTLQAAYNEAIADIARIECKLADGWQNAVPRTAETRLAASPRRSRLTVRVRTRKAKFLEDVRRAKEYIAAGDIFQVVLSQRWDFEPAVAPFDLYRALRTVNPSPYMYFLRFGECGMGASRSSSVSLRTLRGSSSSRAQSRTSAGEAIHIVGSSPEMLVRASNRKLEYRPIAGTHPRGKDEAEDDALEKKMLADEKERAEHVMLVDLGRNDLGRVSEYGSVKVRDLMYVERYSHVMHIVSALEGRLRAGVDAMDAFAACFPAGTLSGAPKVRAMQIIEELEPTRRAIYGGSVFYADFAGNLDSCIAIRTLLMKGKKAYLQAGAGIVADSDPEREFEETENKSRAVLRAVDVARGR